jgi:localization factor PodJL
VSAAAPWSVKGIDPKAREVAKDLARRSGMTLGEWLNTMIMDDGEDEEIVVPLSRRAHAAEAFDRRSRSRRLDDAYDREPGYSRDSYAASSPSFSDDTLQRVAASVDAIAARLEAAERRSTVAIQGVDQAVAGLVRRLDGADKETRTYGRRIDDISEELKEGHRRLRRFEQEVGPDTKATFGKVETGIGAIAARLYDIEERQRTSLNELRQRMDVAEKSVSALPNGQGAGTEAMATVSARLDTAQARTTEALRGLERSFAGLDQRLRAAEGRVEPEGSREAARFEKLAETLARQVDANRAEMIQRLDTAEREGRMDRIERAMAAIGEQARTAEQRSAQGIDAMGREVLRIAQNLNGRMQAADARATALDAAIQRVETGVSDKIARAGQAIAADLNSSLSDKLDRDMGRYAQAVEHRLNRTDDQHALALEKLGGEITRISDRLADRIAQSERKSAQALEDIGRRLSDSSSRIEQTYDRASGELAERMRLSEERTARLLEEARERIESRVDRAARSLDFPEPIESPRAASTQTAASDLSQPDWRSAAFPDEDFGAAPDDIWSTDPLASDERAPAPFPGRFGEPEAAETGLAFDPARAVAEILASPRLAQPVEPAIEPSFSTPVFAQPAQAAAAPQSLPEPFAAPTFGGFGGADVEDALEATAAAAPDIYAPETYAAEAPAPEPEPAFAPQAPAAASFGAPPAFDPAAAFDAGPDEFAAETDFVDARSMRAGLAVGAGAGRASSTRSAIDAARAAMTTTADAAEEPRSGFGLKRGGKSRLQERLDKQASRGSTVRKGLLASVTGMALVGALYTTNRLAGGEGFAVPGMDGVRQALGLAPAPAPATEADLGGEATPLAAVALTPTDAVPLPSSEAQALYDQATQELDGGKPEGVATLTRAANMGLAAAQLKLVGMYETGENGVTANLNEARLWARRAAGNGDPKGMHAYGMYLYQGVGGATNHPEGLNWLLKAADRGEVDSQFNAARIYEVGADGVAPNPTEAYKWYLIAAHSGDQDSQAAVERLTPVVPAVGRRAARAAAEAFQTDPLG